MWAVPGVAVFGSSMVPCFALQLLLLLLVVVVVVVFTYLLLASNLINKY